MKRRAIFDKCVNFSKSHFDTAYRQIFAFSIVMFINFPLYYGIWMLSNKESYESLALRLSASFLCLPLIFHSFWPSRLKRFFLTYSYVTILYCLPFFFTFMTLKNNGSSLWLMNSVSAIFFMILLVDLISVFVLLIVGVSLALAIFFYVSGSFTYDPGVVTFPGVVATFLAAIIIGSIFSHNKAAVEKEKLEGMKAFGATIAHELRTPLTTIGMGILPVQQALPRLIEGYEQSVARGEAAPIEKRLLEGMEKSIDYIIRSVNYAQTTITTILAGFHYSEGDAPILTTPFSLKSMLDKAIADYPFDVGEEDWVVVKHIDDVKVLGEEQMMVHVLYNLIKNALHVIHAEGHGNITVWSELAEDKLYLYVEDNAKGIAPDELSHIFEAFYTTKQETAVSVGLGLYFCKTVLRKMAGDIICESELGHYTRFKLTLTLAL